MTIRLHQPFSAASARFGMDCYGLERGGGSVERRKLWRCFSNGGFLPKAVTPSPAKPGPGEKPAKRSSGKSFTVIPLKHIENQLVA
jgi:hypothetical protein